MVLDRSPLGWVCVAAALAIAGCRKSSSERAAPSAPPAAAPADARPGDAAAAAKPVPPTPLTKRDTKPGAAALGRNALLPLGDLAAKPPAAARGRFVLRYDGADSPTRASVRKAGVLEQIIPQLNQSLRLPRDIAVVYAPCDEINAFYDPDAVTITMCDEYVDYYGELFAEYPADERQPAILGAVASTFLHEAGHALIHQLALPTVGREEDVADQLSTVILVASGDAGNALALDGAYAFIAESEGEVDDTPYWDEHALNEQRFYNTVCLIYGSDPEGWDDLVGEDDLPEERAEQCPDEYAQISTSWNRLLAPFLTVPTVRVKLEAK
jgi:hypothetical protein